VDQVEAEALALETLQALFAAAIAEFWDETAYQAACEREDREAEVLQ
jgi:hypothetical protein